MKQLNSKKTRFPRFDKILVIQPIAEVYGVGNDNSARSMRAPLAQSVAPRTFRRFDSSVWLISRIDDSHCDTTCIRKIIYGDVEV